MDTIQRRAPWKQCNPLRCGHLGRSTFVVTVPHTWAPSRSVWRKPGERPTIKRPSSSASTSYLNASAAVKLAMKSSQTTNTEKFEQIVYRPIRHFLALSANLPTGLYILPSVIFTIFSPNERYLRERLSIRTSFSDSSRDVAWQAIFGQNWQNDLHSALWHFKADWNIAIWISSFIAPMILHTLCTNCVKFGPVTPEIEVWEICTFKTIRQRAAYLTEYLNNYWTNLHQRFSFGSCVYGAYKGDISFALVQGTLLW